jgi:hypothetical protein
VEDVVVSRLCAKLDVRNIEATSHKHVVKFISLYVGRAIGCPLCFPETARAKSAD